MVGFNVKQFVRHNVLSVGPAFGHPECVPNVSARDGDKKLNACNLADRIDRVWLRQTAAVNGWISNLT